MEKTRRRFVQEALALGAGAKLGLPEMRGKASAAEAATFTGAHGVSDDSENAAYEGPPYIFEDNFVVHQNVAWRVEEGKLADNPIMAGRYPWDMATPFYSGTVLIDPIDKLTKCWGICIPENTGFKWGEWDFRMSYATSEDGLHWERPMLDGFPCMGHEKSNVLLDLDDGGYCYQMSVFVNPEAEPSHRYEMFILRNPGYKNPSGKVKGLPAVIGYRLGLFRYYSSDGMHWKAVEGPITIESADSLFVYKNLGAPYVAYHKMGVMLPPGSAYAPSDPEPGKIRILVRRESPDGSHWSDPPLPVFTPEWLDSHDTQFSDIGPIRQGSGYIASVSVWHVLNQELDIEFAGSVDGKKWFRPIPRRPCVPLRPVGDVGGGHTYISSHLVEDGDLLHVYYAGQEGPADDLYVPDILQRMHGVLGQEVCYPHGGLCRASWRKGRLWCILPSSGGTSEGIVVTPPYPKAVGKTLFINAKVLDGGELSAELLGNEREPVAGYRRADCTTFHGDSTLTPLAWGSNTQCPQNGLSIRFYLRRARLYGFEWR